MSQVHLAHPGLLYLLWVLPAVAILFVAVERRRRRALGEFSQIALSRGNFDRRRRMARNLLLVGALCFIVLAAAGIGVDPHSVKIKQRGREVAFLVDVSRSMLAQDLAPNRLARAKSEILQTLPDLDGDRVALVAFAGSASVLCPLTHDYTFFANSVKRLSPTSVAVGGTMIGDAIRYTMRRVFRGSSRVHKDIILLSDGGDQGSYPVRAASEAGGRGVTILTIGLGNQTTGTPIPATGTSGSGKFITYKHERVLSKLNGALMRKIALATPGGRYLDVGTGSFNLAAIYRAFVSEAAKSNLGARTVTVYRQLFQFFLFAAILLLGAELVILKRSGRRAGI